MFRHMFIPKINGICLKLNKFTPLIQPTRCKTTNIEGTEERFTPVYKLPGIQKIGLINRLKLYHTAFSCLAIPTAIACCNYGVISGESAGVTVILGLSGALTLFGVGVFPNKLIGFVYLNDDGDVAKVSYLDFWGHRKNILVPSNDVVPLSDLASTPFDFLYLAFRRYSVKDTLKISMKFGVVLDKEKFNKVFLQV